MATPVSSDSLPCDHASNIAALFNNIGRCGPFDNPVLGGVIERGEPLVAAAVMDISKRGLRVRVPEEFSPGTSVVLSLRYPGVTDGPIYFGARSAGVGRMQASQAATRSGSR